MEEKSPIAYIESRIEQFKNEGLLSKDFELTSYNISRMRTNPRYKGYIWLDGFQGKEENRTFIHWEGENGRILFCTKHKVADNTVPIWNKEDLRVKHLNYLSIEICHDLDINMSNFLAE